MYEVTYTKVEAWSVDYTVEVDPGVFERETGKRFEDASEDERLRYVVRSADSYQGDEEYLYTLSTEITQEKLIEEV